MTLSLGSKHRSHIEIKVLIKIIKYEFIWLSFNTTQESLLFDIWLVINSTFSLADSDSSSITAQTLDIWGIEKLILGLSVPFEFWRDCKSIQEKKSL